MRKVGERCWEPVTRHHNPDVERENTAQYGDEAVQVAITEPGKATVEQEIAKKDDPAPFEMHHDVAFAMGRAEIGKVHGVVGQMERKVVPKGLVWRADHHGVVIG